jgi:hypothetical protein
MTRSSTAEPFAAAIASSRPIRNTSRGGQRDEVGRREARHELRVGELDRHAVAVDLRHMPEQRAVAQIDSAALYAAAGAHAAF